MKKTNISYVMVLVLIILLNKSITLKSQFGRTSKFPLSQLPNASKTATKNTAEKAMLAYTLKNQLLQKQFFPFNQQANNTIKISEKTIPFKLNVKYFLTSPAVQNIHKVSLTMPELQKEPSIKETSNIENLLKKKYIDTLVKEHLTKLSPQVQEKLLNNAAINENIAQKITNKFIDNMKKQKENTLFNKTKQLTSKISNALENITEKIEDTLDNPPGSGELTNFLDSIKKQYSENNQTGNDNKKKKSRLLKNIKKQLNNIKKYIFGNPHKNAAKKLIEKHSILPPKLSDAYTKKNF